METFLAIGECLIEHRAADAGFYFAGDTFNVAYYMAKSSSGELLVRYATAVGDDAVSEQLLPEWQRMGIDTVAVGRIADKAVGHYWIDLDEHGERSFRYRRDDSAARYILRDVDSRARVELAIASADMIYLSAITLAILDHESREQLYRLLLSAKQRGACIVMDNNYRARLWSSVEVCQQAMVQFEPFLDIAMYSLDDARDIHQQANLSVETIVNELHHQGVGLVVVKGGERGYWLAAVGETMQHHTVTPVKVVDSTCAGDAFNAGFLSAYCQGLPLVDCGQQGYQLAAMVVQHPGAIV